MRAKLSILGVVSGVGIALPSALIWGTTSIIVNVYIRLYNISRRNITMSIRQLLEEVYQLYPRKMGKSQGMKTALRVIKTPEDVEYLKKAINKYRQHLLRHQTEPKFYMYFSTFMNQWTDWLEESVGSVDGPLKVDKWSQLRDRK